MKKVVFNDISEININYALFEIIRGLDSYIIVKDNNHNIKYLLQKINNDETFTLLDLNKPILPHEVCAGNELVKILNQKHLELFYFNNRNEMLDFLK